MNNGSPVLGKYHIGHYTVAVRYDSSNQITLDLKCTLYHIVTSAAGMFNDYPPAFVQHLYPKLKNRNISLTSHTGKSSFTQQTYYNYIVWHVRQSCSGCWSNRNGSVGYLNLPTPLILLLLLVQEEQRRSAKRKAAIWMRCYYTRHPFCSKTYA